MIDITWLSAVLVGAGCFALGYYIGVRLHVRPLNSGPKYKYALPKNSKKDGTPLALEVERLADILEDFKMVISLICSAKSNVLPSEGRGVLKSEPLAYLMQVLVVRNDLKMGKGKIAAQCSHATLGLYKKLVNRAPKALNRWEMCGQVKVVLKTETEDDMLVLQEKAKLIQLPTHITIDAGRTQIAPNSRTVMAILGPADMVDDVTGGLKLL